MTGAEYYAREGWDSISVTYGHDYGLCCHLMAPRPTEFVSKKPVA